MLGEASRERAAQRRNVLRCVRPWAAVAALGLASTPRPAHGADFEIDGDVFAQGYDVAGPWGDVLLARKRFGAVLGFAAYDLQGESRPLEAAYSVALRMRVDTDFGYRAGETDYPDDPTLYVPGMAYAPVDLMYGYVEGRDLGGGWFGFRVGRQYVTDVLGWWSFDGALLRLTTPFYVQAEVYGGLEQRGGLPLSSPRFERPGVWRGSHGDLEGDLAADFPSYQYAAPAPAVGFAVESAGPNWIHGRFDYRRVWSTSAAFTQQFPSPGNGGYPQAEGLRLSSERLGYAGSAFLPEIGGAKGGFVYDVGAGVVSRAYGALEFHVGEPVTLGAEVDYFVPTFDLDSIWNWFTHDGITTTLARVALRPVEHLDVTVSGGARLWMAEGDPAAYRGADVTSIAPDLVTDVGARYAWGTGHVRVHGGVETGFGAVAQNRGRRGGADVAVAQELVPDHVWLGAGTSVYGWSDPLRTQRDATSFGYVVAPEFAPADFVRARVEWEHDLNRLVGQRFRVLGSLSFRAEVSP